MASIPGTMSTPASALATGPDQHEQHRGRLVTAVAPGVPRSVLDDQVVRRQPPRCAVVEFQVEFAIEQHAIVDGVGGVHAGAVISKHWASPGSTCMYSPPAAAGSKLGLIITVSGGNVTNMRFVPP